MDSSPGAPLRVLSLDGGGIRGKSSLLILENIMETIRQTKGLESVPRPCEHFDLIGGTSTGGISAIMLGRLGMTVEQCMQAYDKVAQTAFTPKRTAFIPASPRGAYSAQALEGAIKQTVKEFCAEPSCIDQRHQGRSTVESCPHENAAFRNASCTKTAILAITKDNVDAAPTLFTTYDTATNLSYRGCAIWQVARATSAATTFFKSIKVGRDNVEFIDAGFGCNNPCEVLIEEARRQFPNHGALQVLSIGTGLGDVVTIKDSRRTILEALAKMASTSTTVARKLYNQYGDSGQYHRFNVERGLQDITLSDWEKTSTISAHTGNYLQDNRVEIQKFVDSFINCPRGEAEATGSHGTPPSSSVPHYISLPRNRHFVGRTERLKMLNEKLFSQDGHRRVCLYGLGGVGKTQVALRIAYEAKDVRGIMVLWLLAASSVTFQQACAEAVKRLTIQGTKDDDPKELLQGYLNSDKAGKWLLVIDNIDEIDTLLGSPDQPGIHFFLPNSDNGRILFTTRPYDIATRVADDDDDIVELKEMSHSDAKQYLEGKIQLDQVGDDAAATELLDQLAHLPLAITQAAAYMKRNKKPVREYLDLLRRTESDMVELMSWEFYDRNRYDGSQNAVALTWQVSFRQICDVDNTAAELLRFISRIEPKAIPRSMLPIRESEIRFDHAIGTLIGYALLDVREGGETYDMHSLVHLATRTWIKTQGYETKVMADAVAHLSVVFPSYEWENRYVWRQYLPHALRLLHEDNWGSEESTELGLCVGCCLREDGQYKDAIKVLQGVVSVQEKTLAENHPNRLASEHLLASAYITQDGEQLPKAIKILQGVVSVLEKTLAENHPNRLASEHMLASAYITQDGEQLPKAIELLEHVVSIHNALAENHRDRLASEYVLATAYQKDGQVLKAMELLEHVVSIHKAFAENHRERLASEHALARVYQENGQVLKAIELLEHVTRVRETTPAEDNPNRLISMHDLVIAYITQGGEQLPKAIELLEHATKVEETVLAEDDPKRLGMMHVLATTYITQGGRQLPKAIELLEHVTRVEETTLAEDDAERLESQHALGVAYYTNGRVQEGVERLEHVVSVLKTIRAEDDLNRLISMYELAKAYITQGGKQLPKAIELLEHITRVQETTLAEDDPERLESQCALGMAYYTNGRVQEGVEWLEHVVSVQKRTRAEDDWELLKSERALERARTNCTTMTTFESWFDEIDSDRSSCSDDGSWITIE